jgi:hypothetical protein
MAKITNEKYEYRKTSGLLFHYGTHNEALAFVKEMTPTSEITSGWFKTEWGASNIEAHVDGKGAVFTSANFDKGDREYFYKLIGKEATDLLLRYHSNPTR